MDFSINLAKNCDILHRAIDSIPNAHPLTLTTDQSKSCIFHPLSRHFVVLFKDFHFDSLTCCIKHLVQTLLPVFYLQHLTGKQIKQRQLALCTAITCVGDIQGLLKNLTWSWSQTEKTGFWLLTWQDTGQEAKSSSIMQHVTTYHLHMGIIIL